MRFKLTTVSRSDSLVGFHIPPEEKLGGLYMVYASKVVHTSPMDSFPKEWVLENSSQTSVVRNVGSVYHNDISGNDGSGLYLTRYDKTSRTGYLALIKNRGSDVDSSFSYYMSIPMGLAWYESDPDRATS